MAKRPRLNWPDGELEFNTDTPPSNPTAGRLLMGADFGEGERASLPRVASDRQAVSGQMAPLASMIGGVSAGMTPDEARAGAMADFRRAGYPQAEAEKALASGQIAPKGPYTAPARGLPAAALPAFAGNTTGAAIDNTVMPAVAPSGAKPGDDKTVTLTLPAGTKRTFSGGDIQNGLAGNYLAQARKDIFPTPAPVAMQARDAGPQSDNAPSFQRQVKPSGPKQTGSMVTADDMKNSTDKKGVAFGVNMQDNQFVAPVSADWILKQKALERAKAEANGLNPRAVQVPQGSINFTTDGGQIAQYVIPSKPTGKIASGATGVLPVHTAIQQQYEKGVKPYRDAAIVAGKSATVDVNPTAAPTSTLPAMMADTQNARAATQNLADTQNTLALDAQQRMDTANQGMKRFEKPVPQDEALPAVAGPELRLANPQERKDIGSAIEKASANGDAEAVARLQEKATSTYSNASQIPGVGEGRTYVKTKAAEVDRLAPIRDARYAAGDALYGFTDKDGVRKAIPYDDDGTGVKPDSIGMGQAIADPAKRQAAMQQKFNAFRTQYKDLGYDEDTLLKLWESEVNNMQRTTPQVQADWKAIKDSAIPRPPEPKEAKPIKGISGEVVRPEPTPPKKMPSNFSELVINQMYVTPQGAMRFIGLNPETKMPRFVDPNETETLDDSRDSRGTEARR